MSRAIGTQAVGLLHMLGLIRIPGTDEERDLQSGPMLRLIQQLRLLMLGAMCPDREAAEDSASHHAV